MPEIKRKGERKMKKQLAPGISSTGEKIRFALGDVGCNFIWTFMASFLTLYYTDSVLLSASVAGTIMMIARLFDGVSDVIMGIIIEKTSTKWGKARPWLLWGVIPLIISYLLVFNVPSGLNDTGKTIYVFLTYTILSAVTYTAVNMAYMTLFTLFAPDSDDRNMAAMIRTLFVLFAALVISIVTTIVLGMFGGESSQRAWTIVTMIYSIIAGLCLMITFLGVKEKTLIAEAKTTEPETKEKKSLLPMIKLLFTSKYFYIFAFLSIVYYLTSGIGGGTVYFARDILGDANYYGLLTIVNMVPMIIGTIIAPVCYKRFGKRNTMFTGSLIMFAAALMQLISPGSLIWFLAFACIKGMGSVLFAAAIPTLVGDVVDWSEWKSGERSEGLVTSVSSFGSKVGTGIGAGLVGWVLAWGHYDSLAAIQPQSALTAEIMLVIGIPAMIAFIQMILLVFWDIDKIRPQMIEDIRKRKETEN